ncbi:Multiple coagulation factor deficiency protein 2 like [Pseudolycoriella hygida]|uniref:Multiple coagulation factor deficiency protein 2 like n=1 Tax=Pseudolycoriella hygida TaxID=35572 RepID=A0A9Q0MSX9_9DIPT|nr:Multiple coagulation factor deficiency protein 2 like [Pseudolycoriella hygida]
MRTTTTKIITFAAHVIFVILIQKVVIRGCNWCFIKLNVECRRGPHHPRSEIAKGRQKMDEHFAHDPVIEHRNISEMTEEEKNFFYFKVHDSDNNDVLDGLELLRAATHHSVHVEHDGDENVGEKEKSSNELDHVIEIIDDFIQFADFNNDGFLNYAEYTQAMKHNTDMPITNHIDNNENK